MTYALIRKSNENTEVRWEFKKWWRKAVVKATIKGEASATVKKTYNITAYASSIKQQIVIMTMPYMKFAKFGTFLLHYLSLNFVSF